MLFIRNRLSDRRYQHAKGTMKVHSKSDYFTQRYKDRKLGGYQIVALPPLIMELIEKYIVESRDYNKMTERAWDNLNNYSKADTVEDESIENYYLFLSKNYTPLSQSGWNTIVKSIFKSVGLPVDTNKKTENLSHRFRHGYAMLLKEMGYSMQDIKEELRHKSITSTQVYAYLTADEKYEISQKVANKIIEIIDTKRDHASK